MIFVLLERVVLDVSPPDRAPLENLETYLLFEAPDPLAPPATPDDE